MFEQTAIKSFILHAPTFLKPIVFFVLVAAMASSYPWRRQQSGHGASNESGTDRRSSGLQASAKWAAKGSGKGLQTHAVVAEACPAKSAPARMDWHTDAPSAGGCCAKSAPASSSQKWRRIEQRSHHMQGASARSDAQRRHEQACDELQMKAHDARDENQTALSLVMRGRMEVQESEQRMTENRMIARRFAETAEHENAKHPFVQASEMKAFQFAAEANRTWKGVRSQLQTHQTAVERGEQEVRKTLDAISTVRDEISTCDTECGEWDDRVTACQTEFNELQIAQEHRLTRDECAERDILEVQEALQIQQRRETRATRVFDRSEVAMEQALEDMLETRRQLESSDWALRQLLMQAELDSRSC